MPAIAAVLVLAIAVAGTAWYRFRRPVPAVIQAPSGQAPSDAQATAEPRTGGQSQPAGQSPAGGQSQPGETAAAGQPPASKGLIARAADAIRSAVDAVIPPAKEAAPQAEITPADAPKPKPKGSHSRRASAATPAPAPSPVAPPTGEITSVHTEPIREAEPASVATVTAMPGRAVYTSADQAVMPPVMIRPVLPAVPPPGVSPDQVGTLELIIDETGSVEQVKLTSPTNRYQERMLVSHAKSWKFKPALRDGQPVKYRTRVRVTI